MIDQAVQLLRAGKLVAFPTETVYGLGADATRADAVQRIFDAKGRPATNPLIVHVADIETARKFTTGWSDAAQTLAATWWPGPLTLVLPKHPSIVDEATAGLATVGLRVPDHPLALALLRAFGGAIAAPSANRSNHLSPTTAQHVSDDLGTRVDLVLDGGPCKVGIESTVLDLTGDVPAILRPGGVSRKQLEFILGAVNEGPAVIAGTTAAASPGQQEIHYAPLTPAVRFETSQRGLIHPQTDAQSNGIVVLSPLKIFKKWGPIVAMPNDPVQYAQHLYAVLHELDEMRLRTIYVEMPPDKPEWTAIRDRIRRATTPL